MMNILKLCITKKMTCEDLPLTWLEVATIYVTPVTDNDSIYDIMNNNEISV